MRCLKRCPGLHSGHAMPPCRHTNRGARDWQSLPLEVELICCVASAPAQRLTRDDMKNWTDQKRFVDVAGPFGMLPLLHWTDADEDAEVKGSACAVMRPVIAPHELIYLLVSYCAVGTLLTYTGRRNALPAHCFPDAQHRSVPAPQTLVSRRVFTPPLLYLADSCHVVAISGDFG